jgi:hypothetical protein
MNHIPDSQGAARPPMKSRLLAEGKRFLAIFLYFALCLALLLNYKRAILADYSIRYLDYGYAFVEALILAKIVMIGQILQLERRVFGDRPLIYATLYSALVFSLLVVCFGAIEQTIDGWLHHRTLAETFQRILSHGWHEMLAKSLFMFVVFLPYFAFREIGATLGEGTLFKLFFHRRTTLTDAGARESKRPAVPAVHQ